MSAAELESVALMLRTVALASVAADAADAVSERAVFFESEVDVASVAVSAFWMAPAIWLASEPASASVVAAAASVIVAMRPSFELEASEATMARAVRLANPALDVRDAVSVWL